MPLVSLNTIDRWYRKDSWVYRAFTYLFQNQLWDLDVPSGFSLCPYFWLALFSLTFFRVFVYGVLGIRILFAPFGKLLDYTDSCANVFFRKKNYSRGTLTLCGFALGSILGGGSFVVFVASKVLITAYAANHALPALILPVLGIINLAVCKTIDNICYKSRANLFCVANSLVLLAIGAYLMSHELWEVVRSIAVVLFAFCYHYVPESIVSVCHAIVFTAKWFWHGIVWCVAAVFYYLLYLLGALAVGSAIGVLADRYTNRNQFDIDRDDGTRLTPEQRKQYYKIAKDAAHFIWTREYRTGKDEDYWYEYVLFRVPEAAALIQNCVLGKMEQSTGMMFERIEKAVINTHDALNTIKFKRAQKRAERICTFFSKLSKIVTTIIPVHHMLNGLKWVASQSWTFLCLLYELIKAKKTGACPYLKFKD